MSVMIVPDGTIDDVVLFFRTSVSNPSREGGGDEMVRRNTRLGRTLWWLNWFAYHDRYQHIFEHADNGEERAALHRVLVSIGEYEYPVEPLSTWPQLLMSVSCYLYQLEPEWIMRIPWIAELNRVHDHHMRRFAEVQGHPVSTSTDNVIYARHRDD